MTLALCIASRGRAGIVANTVAVSLAHAKHAATRVALGLDADDDAPAFDKMDRLVISRAARPDTLAAVHNRLHDAVKADIYIMAGDETPFITPSWDAKIENTLRVHRDGYAVAGQAHENGIAFWNWIAVTDRLVGRIGFYAAPWFPFWWHDTWLYEVGCMLGRLVLVDVSVQPNPAKSRGVRDIKFWAELFECSRDMRRLMAESLIADPSFDEPAWRKAELLALMPSVCDMLRSRNVQFTNESWAAQVAAEVSFDAPADARYLRARQAAEDFLAMRKVA